MFRSKQPALLSAYGLLLAILGVGGHVEDQAMAGGTKTVTVTEKDSGRTVKLARGDTLVVRLEGNVGTGYSWGLTKNNASVLPLQSQTTERLDQKQGGKFVAIFRFTSKAAGRSDLECGYARPFEKDKAPARSFKLNVVVE